MRGRGLVLVPFLLASVPAAAQPFIFPLQQQRSSDQGPPASAPPVAPPQAGPSLPTPGLAGNTGGNSEEAYQPGPRTDQATAGQGPTEQAPAGQAQLGQAPVVEVPAGEAAPGR